MSDERRIRSARFHWSERRARRRALAATAQLRLELDDILHPDLKGEARIVLVESAISALREEIVETLRHDVRRPTVSCIERPPGMRLDRLARLLPKRSYEHVLKPCLAEMQEEYFIALQAGDERAAKRARFWGAMAFWCHVLGLIPESIIRMVLKLRT